MEGSSHNDKDKTMKVLLIKIVLIKKTFSVFAKGIKGFNFKHFLIKKVLHQLVHACFFVFFPYLQFEYRLYILFVYNLNVSLFFFVFHQQSVS